MAAKRPQPVHKAARRAKRIAYRVLDVGEARSTRSGAMQAWMTLQLQASVGRTLSRHVFLRARPYLGRFSDGRKAAAAERDFAETMPPLKRFGA